MSFGVKTSGNYKNAFAYLESISSKNLFADLHRWGKQGVAALARNTPVETSETSRSWDYRIVKGRDGSGAIVWFNTHEEDGVNVAILIQYGHGTGTGGYVVGRDYINPAIQPIFDQIADDIWKKVTHG